MTSKTPTDITHALAEEALASGIVPGPFTVDRNQPGVINRVDHVVIDAHGMWFANVGNDPAGAAWIAAARTREPQLAQAVLELLDRCKELTAALAEACDWATPFDSRHHDRAGGYASELLPMHTRVGDRTRTDRIAALRKLADGADR